MTTLCRWQQRFQNFTKALVHLEDACNELSQRNLSFLERQGLVQAYEFTHELAWKTMKDFLEETADVKCLGSKDSTRAAFKLGIVENGQIWINMIESRNISSHTYNEEAVVKVVEDVQNFYLHEFQKLSVYFKSKMLP